MFNRKPQPETAAPESNEASSAGSLSGEDIHSQVLRLTRERDEALTQWKRAMADFQNFQRRSRQNEVEAERQGITSVLTSVLPVLDHFDLALAQPTPDESTKRILDGVRVIRSELLRAMEGHGVSLISPKPNDEFDPNRHSAITQLSAEGVEPGRVSSTFQPGYALGDRVIRSAKVAVAPAMAEPENLGKPNERGEYDLDQ